MKKFVFTLQKLYDVKQSEEKQKRVELKELGRTLLTYKKQRKANQNIFNKQHGIYDKKCRTGLTMNEVKQYGDYFQYLEREMREQDAAIAKFEADIEICKKGLLRLINEENVLDRMREEQLQEYRKEVQKNDDKMIEDFIQGRL